MISVRPFAVLKGRPFAVLKGRAFCGAEREIIRKMEEGINSKHMTQFTCRTEEDLLPAAEKLLVSYPDSRVFAFYGKMGAGKTTFIKAVCRELGVEDLVQSPSFAIIHEYKSNAGSLFHFDFYRIKTTEEVFDLGYEDYFFSGSYCFIEWPGFIEELLPDDVIRVTIEVDEEEGLRVINF